MLVPSRALHRGRTWRLAVQDPALNVHANGALVPVLMEVANAQRFHENLRDQC